MESEKTPVPAEQHLQPEAASPNTTLQQSGPTAEEQEIANERDALPEPADYVPDDTQSEEAPGPELSAQAAADNQPEEVSAASEQIAAAQTEAQTPAPETQPAGSWWDALAFEGKDFTELRPDGMLVLKATPFAPARELQQLHPESAEATVKALTGKFSEVQTKVRELASEWNFSEDKKKLSGRVERVRDYLLHASAIGDFAPLYQQVGLWENHLQEGADKAYAERLALVEKAEALAAGDLKKEGLNELRELTEGWKATGYVDKERADALWQRFETARDTFYNRRREQQDSERAELQSNLDLKTELVDKAERLAASDDWKASTNAFTELMEQWKKTGRTFHDKNEALWQRFITAKNVFYDRKKEHFKEIQGEQDANYEKKLALIARAEEWSDSTDWNKTTDAYNALMDEWKAIGRVPAEKTEELWGRLSVAKDKFFNAKRAHFATMRVTYDDNLAQKQALVNRAETIQNSYEWRDATDEFAELMEEWKKIGPVARRDQNEALWQSFNKARKTFFNRKDEDRDRRRGHMEQARAGRLSQVQEFLSQLRAELKEFEEDLTDHHVAMANLGTSKIDAQIRANLERLISQGSPKLEKKRQKITEVEAQLSELTRDGSRKPQAQQQPKKAEQLKPAEQPAQQMAQDAPPTEEAPDPAQPAQGGEAEALPQETTTSAPQPEAPPTEDAAQETPDTAPTNTNPDDIPAGA